MAAAAYELPARGRKLRSPQHAFHINHRPYQIQPFLIAPVLPGETMKNALMQVRAVTKPVKSPLVGWWLEHYLFYVKHRDLASSETLQNMMLDPSVTAPVAVADNSACYLKTGNATFTKECLDVVVENYFRDRGDAVNAWTIDGIPSAGLQWESWQNSLTPNAPYVAGDMNVDLNANSTITASEVQTALDRWRFLRANNLTDATYEDYLRSYGINVPQEAVAGIPELIRYSREWQYPSNTIDPADGTPSSAVSWVVSERADKDRFFREPGFIFGVTVCRPKVFMSRQIGAAVGLMKDAYAWLPAVLRDDPMTSIRQLATTTEIIPDVANGVWFDMRDLFIYGDQFINFDIVTAGDGNAVALPAATGRLRYPDSAMVSALFVGDSTLRQDGVVKLSIVGALQDHTPRGSVEGYVL